jgi:hypothetical protein
VSYASFVPNVLVPASDPVLGTAEHEYALTYALVLSAAVVAGDVQTIEMTSEWLAAERAMSGGWGSPWAWDPFADGSTNPPDTPYAITTALAVDALLDAGRFAPDDAAALVYWARSAWSDGYYWYSVRRQDAIYTPNVSAMLAGVTARALVERPDLFTPADRELLWSRVDSSFARLARDAMGWDYSERQAIPNDLSHHVYILWGGERFRDAGGVPGWSRAEALATLDRFWDGGELAPYPTDVAWSDEMGRRADSQWMVSGAGIALAFVLNWGGDDRERWHRATLSVAARIPAAPRFAAHAVLGLALAERADRVALR